jgi:hypothetical protein
VARVPNVGESMLPRKVKAVHHLPVPWSPPLGGFATTIEITGQQATAIVTVADEE